MNQPNPDQTQASPELRHDVHIYCTVRVKVAAVEGSTDAERIAKARESVDLYALFDREMCRSEDQIAAGSNTLVCTTFAEEVTFFVVDEIDPVNEEILPSDYGPDGKTPFDNGPVRIIVCVNDGEVVDAAATHQNVELTFVEYGDVVVDEEAIRIPCHDGSGEELAAVREPEVVACDPQWVSRVLEARQAACGEDN